MVDKEVVLETVKKMYESGIEDDVVMQTLRDIGLGPAEIKSYIAEAKGTGPRPVERPEPKPLAQRQAAAEEKADQMALHSTTHIALEEQGVRIIEILEKITALENSLKELPAGGEGASSIAVSQRLASLESQVRDIKSELGATRSIMEKVLETDRKVLNKV